jgi:hypothetical protein
MCGVILPKIKISVSLRQADFWGENGHDSTHRKRRACRHWLCFYIGSTSGSVRASWLRRNLGLFRLFYLSSTLDGGLQHWWGLHYKVVYGRASEMRT